MRDAEEFCLHAEIVSDPIPFFPAEEVIPGAFRFQSFPSAVAPLLK